MTRAQVGARAHDYVGREIHPVTSREFLPAGTRCVEIHSSGVSLDRYNQLPAVERELVVNAVAKRKADFGDCRWCAHEAMRSLDLDGPVMRGERGMPVFPAGVTGSLTHTEGFRAALIGRSSKWATLGIDAEPAVALPEGVFEAISLPVERRRLAKLQHPLAATVLFSAKETTYKSWFPLTHRFLDFDEADIDIRADGTFISTLLASPSPVAEIHGRWTIDKSMIVTAVGVPR